MYAIPYQAGIELDPAEVERKPISGGWVIFIGTWLACCAAGIGAAAGLGQVVLGIVIIAVPTAVGVMASPTFALCCIALVLPLSGSINFQGFLTAPGLDVTTGTFPTGRGSFEADVWFVDVVATVEGELDLMSTITVIT